ncbi:peptidase inhibitor family I36 protein [Plantactinospora solaniradicis]|uniref:Peptidase inhibitor family I36 protein n=1 Tax=Plantactinospora solaniradicis TaxID=1723736 RepID=A0ABW1KGC6_9ACTN
MRLRGTKVLTLVVAAAAATGGLVGVPAGPAGAALSDCGPRYLCAFQATNYNAVPGRVEGNNSNLLQYPSFNNAVSVFNNGMSCGVTIWNGLNRTGTSVYLPRGTGYGNLSTQNPPFYRNIASNQWC